MDALKSAVRGEADEQLYTIRHTAERLAVHEMTVRRKIWAGEIKSVRLGPKIVRVPGSELRRLLAVVA